MTQLFNNDSRLGPDFDIVIITTLLSECMSFDSSRHHCKVGRVTVKWEWPCG